MSKALVWISVGALAALAAGACGGSNASSDVATSGTGGATSGNSVSTQSSSGSTTGATSSGGASSVGATTSSSSGSGGTTPSGGCWDTPPQGATLAAPLPTYSGGSCPMLMPGENTITSNGNTRKFLLALPSKIDPNVHMPLVFLWHWLGGNAQAFFDKAEIQSAVDTQNFVAIAPVAKGDIQFHWPFSVADSQARTDEELKFFDDMLACAANQFAINKECVSSAGVSAGALFTDQLGSGRADRLSSIISLSGGVGGVIKPWGHPAHHLPALVLWGGPTDNCFGLLSFADGSHTLEDGLTQDGSFFVECQHNCGHAAPPFDAPMGLSKYAGLWDFAFDHPFWLQAGDSPYKKNGLPTALPMWCGIGKGSAMPRTGACPDKPGC